MDDHKDTQDVTPGAVGNAAPLSNNDSHSPEIQTTSTTFDHNADPKAHHIKQDSVDSYNTSSSSSSVDFKEANSGEKTPEQADVTALRDTEGTSSTTIDQDDPSSSPTSLDKRLSRVSLVPSKASGNEIDSASSIQNQESSRGDVESSSNKSEKRNSTSSSRRVSLQQPETPSSPVAVEYQSNDTNNNDLLLKKQLDAHGVQEERDSEHWRDSTVNDTTSPMDTVALSDSRPNSQTIPSVAADENSSLRDVDIPIDAPAASTSAGTSNGQHLSAKNTSAGEVESSEMGITPTRQSTASSTHNYDLIQQRAENHHHDLEEHPKRHRRTLRGSEDLRASFDKLREELSGPSTDTKPDSPIREAPPLPARKSASGAPAQDTNVIDWDFWGEVMSDYEGIAKTRPRDLSKAIQNGIPAALRGMMWQLMSASKDPELEQTYSQLLRLPSIHEKAIIRDLNRTFPTHEFFNDKAGIGQNNLLNIMKAYSLYDDEVGYCQGMAFVVGPLLLNMPDEEAFCVLVRLMKSYDLRSQYIPDMPGLQLRLYQFDRLLEELLPAVFMHLLRQGIKSSMYASQWFLTLLAYRFPLELVCSVFDLIFAEGVEAIFRFALAVMKKNEDQIVQMEFEQVLEFLKTGLFEEYKHQLEEGTSTTEAPTYSAQTFVKEALQVKITPMMLDQYTSEWTEMCKQQNAQSVEVEQLRSINKKLSNQVRNLESSLAQINQEHCELVKQVVATRLEKEELEDELVRVKMALAQESLLREEGRGSIASRGSYASFGSAPMSPYDERRDSQLSIPK